MVAFTIHSSTQEAEAGKISMFKDRLHRELQAIFDYIVRHNKALVEAPQLKRMHELPSGARVARV